MDDNIELNGISEREECPMCGNGNAVCHHGTSATYPMHMWNCPECGSWVAVVCFHCLKCGQKVLEVV